MRRSLFAVAAVAAATLVALPAAASASSHSLTVRGMTLKLPSGWKVYGKGDDIRVVTGKCAKPKAGWGEPECDSFWILGPKAIKEGQELFSPYTGKRPYYPATDVQLCPMNHKIAQSYENLATKGLRKVGPGHNAAYKAWNFACRPYEGKQTIKSRYVQREWFLPTSKILIVDQWSTPGLPGVLKHASWN